jgi:hypothetical protein
MAVKPIENLWRGKRKLHERGHWNQNQRDSRLKQVGTWHEPLTTAGKSIDSVASFETLAMKIAYALAFSKPESLQW